MKNKKIKGRKLNKKENIHQLDTTQILIGAFLLLIGIALGITVSLSGTFALEAATATNATSSNATATNATSSNATTSNATSSNATATNATSSNAQKTDNIIYLNSIKLKSEKTKPEEKVYIEKNTSGACNTAMSLTFWNELDDIKFTVDIEELNNNPYFIVPKNITSGSYRLINVLLVGLNSDNTTFSKEYSNITNETIDSELTSSVLNIETVNNKKIEFSDLTVNNNGIIGEKVTINFNVSEKLTSLKLVFKNENDNSFSVHVQSLASNPYFIIPSETKEGNYYLYQAIFSTNELSTVYTNGENYNFKCSLNIKKNTEKTYYYNNKDINEEIIKEIYNEEKDIDITINADENPIISSELFNAIKGTKKNLIINYKENKIIFCGNDIKTTKSINVSISTTLVNKDNNIKEFVNEGIILNFTSNGNLPGNAIIKIKVTDEMKEIFHNNKIYIYYYDEDKKGFNIIAKEIIEKDGYYEFTISHNSKYILTKTQINDKLILEEEENIVHFQQSNSHYLLWIGMSVLLIAAVIIVIIIIKKKEKNNK